MKLEYAILPAALLCLATGCVSYPVATCSAKAEADSLRVSVASLGTDGRQDTLSSTVSAAVKKTLADKGFKVEDGEHPDVRVSLDTAIKEYNRAGDFIVYDGKVAARAMVPSRENRVLGEEILSARGARALGEDAAVGELVKVLVPQVSEWASRTVAPGSTGIRAQSVTVSYPRTGLKNIPQLKLDFVAAALALPGVRDCALVSEGYDPLPTATFRVVYDEGAFPAGFVNELAARNPELKLRPGATR